MKRKLEIKWKSILLYGGVPLLLILLVAGAIYLFTGRAEAIDSIAVLPFKNLTGDPEQEYFVEGFTNELIWQLGRIGKLRIISLTSAMRYKETEKPLPEIAHELNVDAVVEGTVQQVGDSVSVGVRLVDVFPEERSLWEQTYDQAMTDVFLMYSAVARAITREIKVKLTPNEEAHFTSTRPVDPEAYEAYLKAEFHWGLGTAEGHEKGLAFYHQAIEKDTTFAMAYAGLAFAYNSIGHSSMATPDSFPRALAAHQKLAEVAPQRIWSLGRTYALAGKRDEARKILAELEKEEVTLSRAYDLARLYTAMGEKDEAFRLLEVAYEHPPYSFPWLRVGPWSVPLRDDPRFKDLLRRMNLPQLDESP